MKDWNRRLFDALIPLPYGTSYNAYLVLGSEKTVLIDTVNPGFEKLLENNIREHIEPQDLDYVVMNHAEPDHAGAIPYMLSLNKKAKLITTEKGAKMAQAFYNVPKERILIVKDEETISLGGKTLKFIYAPWLHWPETMFTYAIEDKILFPCDFFGSHIAHGIYDEDVPEWFIHAKRYFGEIMMPFRNMAQRALEKIKALKIEIIAPSHGFIYNKKVKDIVKLYNEWASGKVKRKALIIYVSMWKSTEKMVNKIADTLLSKDIKVTVHDLTVADIGNIASDLVDSAAIVLGAPTVLAGIHPLGMFATYLVKALRPPTKFIVMLSSYGWFGVAVKQLLDMLKGTNMEIVGTVEINGLPTTEDLLKINEVGEKLAEKIKEAVKE